MKLASIKVNSAAIESGRWIDVPDLPGVSLHVRGIGNADFRRLNAKLIEAVPRAERIKGLTPETSDSIQTRLFVETVLLDWRGIENDDGSPLPFDKDTASRLLADPDYARLRSAVAYAGAIVGDDEAAGIEADAKN